LRRIARSAQRLEPRGRRHAVRALGWLVAARVLLRLAPYAAVHRLLTKLPARRAAPSLITPAECTVAIDRAARLVPGTACLARAVAADCLLRRDGRDTVLSIGVCRDRGPDLEAHAWVESDGVIVTGGEEARQFTRLAPRPGP
jgi:hypothetical protein